MATTTGANVEITVAPTTATVTVINDVKREAATTKALSTKSIFAWQNALRWIFDYSLVIVSSCTPPSTNNIFPSWPSTWGFGRITKTIVIGTILCPGPEDHKKKNVRVRVCFQESGGAHPFLLLELPLGIRELLDSCRITLECCGGRGGPHPLVGEETWSVWCNGRRREGFGHRIREATEADARAMEAIRTVSAGAGFLPDYTSSSSMLTGGSGGEGLRFVRGRFERVVGSADSEAYHLIDPAGGGGEGQELSFFFLRV